MKAFADVFLGLTAAFVASLLAVLVLPVAGCGHTKAMTYATELQTCAALAKTEAEADACACEVATRYGRREEIQQRGVVCQ